MSGSANADTILIGGEQFTKESVWAASKCVSTRTSARYREKGLPFLDWAGLIWIPNKRGDSFLLSLVRRRNPPRAARRRQSSENRDTAA
jgi:hypothetical protein